MLRQTLALLALASSAFAQSVSTRPDGQVIVISDQHSTSAPAQSVSTRPDGQVIVISGQSSTSSSHSSVTVTVVVTSHSSAAPVTSAPPAYTGPMFTGAASANKPVAALLAGAMAAVALA